MAKKLTVEVDAETSKAKQKIRELAETGGSTASTDAIASSASRAAKELGNAAKSAKSLGEASAGSSASLKTMIRSFAGIGVGMAAGYAANYMAPGVGKTSMGYLSAMASGAATGAAFGHIIPGVGTVVGAGIGAVAGAGKQWLDNGKTEKDWFTQHAEGEQNLKETRVWADMFRELTSVKSNFKGLNGLDELKAQLESVQAASERTSKTIEELKKAEAAYTEEIAKLGPDRLTGKFADDGLTADKRIQKATEAASGLALTRQKLSQTEGANRQFAAMIEALEDRIEEFKTAPAARESIEAMDALSRIGGGSFGGDYAREQLAAVKETVTVLKSIDQKTNNGVGTWQ